MRKFPFPVEIVSIAIISIAALIWIVNQRHGKAALQLPGVVGTPTPNLTLPSTSFDYQGAPVKTAKPYSSYEDYKDDPGNLAPEETGKVQQLVRNAPIAKHFPSREQMTSAVFELKFPGYGLTADGESVQADGSTLTMFGVEIPKSDTTRYLVFRGENGAFLLVDDFVQPDSEMIGSVKCNGQRLLYSAPRGTKLLEHPVPAQ